MIAAAALVASAAATSPAHAGFFDFLFGGSDGFEQPRYRPSYGGPALGVRVNPRRRPKVASLPGGTQQPRTRAGRGAKDAAAPAKIDPIKNPDWYLSDATLRRGDIVVLKGKVVVFEGGRVPLAREDFTALEKSNLVSKKERDAIKTMARNTDAYDEPSPPAKSGAIEGGAKEASLREKP